GTISGCQTDAWNPGPKRTFLTGIFLLISACDAGSDRVMTLTLTLGNISLCQENGKEEYRNIMLQ
ncbi:MAG: hypothetical protein AAFV07_09005, partial [Bacteroidota bacterium]